MKSLEKLGLLLALGVIWGSGYSLAKYATSNGVNPLGYAFWQSLGPTLLLLAFALKAKARTPLSSAKISYFLICGLVGIALPNTNMYYVAPKLPAGILAVIVNTVPIFTYPLALLFRQERFSLSRFLGVGLACVGLMLIALPKAVSPSLSDTPWILQALLSPLCFALCAIYIHRNAFSKNSLASAAGMLLASSLLLAPVILYEHAFYAFHWPLTKPDQAVLLEIALSSLGYVIFFRLIEGAGSVYYSLVGCIVALTGIGWGFLLFGEWLSLPTFIGVICIFSAIAVVSFCTNKAYRSV